MSDSAPPSQSSWLRDPRGSYAALKVILGPVGIYPVLVLLGVQAMERFDIAAFGILGPEVRNTFGLSNAEYLSIATLSSVLPLLLSAHLGYFVDKTHRVRFGAFGALLWTLFAIATGLSPVLAVLIVARLGAGIGLLVNTPVHQSLIADWYPPEALAPTLSLLLVATGAIDLLAGPVAGQVGQWAGWRTTFVVLAVPALIFVFLMSRLREPARGESLGLDLASEERATFWEGFRRVRAIGALKRTWYAAFFFGSGVVAFTALAPLYFKDVYHLGPADRGYIAAARGLTGLCGLFLGGWISQRAMRAGRPERLPVINGLMVVQAGVGMVLMGLAPNVWLSVLAICFLAIGLSGFTPAYTIMVAIVAPPRLRGQAISYSLLFVTLGALVIVPIIGGIGDSGGQRLAVGVLGVLVASAGLVETTARRFVRRDVVQAVALTAAADVDAMLAVRGLEAGYGNVQILFGVDLDVQQGEIVALLGTNGAGKSTLLRAVSGLMDPMGGAMFFNGRDITHADAATKAMLGMALVPGDRGVFPGLTVADNLRIAAWMFRRNSAQTQAATERVLDYFPVLRDRMRTQAGNLSGGEQQMLVLAQALMGEPKILMIDELSLGLAPIIVGQLLDTVKRLADDGTTILLVEQSVNVALTVAKRAVFMEKGEIRFSGPTAELLHRPDVLRAVFLEGTASAVGAAPVRTRRRGLGPSSNGDSPPALEVIEVTKRFGGVMANDSVSLTLHEGEILGILGPNGAGKTTLFDLISGFFPVDRGRILLHDYDITDLPADARARLGLGRSFQDSKLFPALTVADTIRVALERHLEVRDPVAAALHLPAVLDAERGVDGRVEALSEMLGLTAFRNKFVSEISTGTRRMVDLACILAHEPTVILFDEPSSGIAQRESEALGPLLRKIREQTGSSVLVIEHDMPLLTSLADRIVAMDLGQVVMSGPPEEVVHDPRVVAAYLGTSAEAAARSGTLAAEELLVAAGTAASNGRRKTRGRST